MYTLHLILKVILKLIVVVLLLRGPLLVNISYSARRFSTNDKKKPKKKTEEKVIDPEVIERKYTERREEDIAWVLLDNRKKKFKE